MRTGSRKWGVAIVVGVLLIAAAYLERRDARMAAELRQLRGDEVVLREQNLELQREREDLVQRLEASEQQVEKLGKQAEDVHRLRAELARQRVEEKSSHQGARAALSDPRQGTAPYPAALMKEAETLMPADLRPADTWADEGAATPEAACHSLDWSVRAGFTSLPRTANGGPDGAVWAPFSRIVARREIGPEDVEITVEYREVTAGVSYWRRHFRREGDVWQLVLPDSVSRSD